MRTFFYDRRADPEDPRRCRVCGHLSLTPVRRTFNAVLLVIIGMLLAYIVLDIAHNGTVDGGILRAIRDERARLRHNVEASQPR